MSLILHAPDTQCNLADGYNRAISSAIELLIVSAYLTNWSETARLNKACKHFKMIVGKDFGLTRKSACRSVLSWLPSRQRVNFRVADQIDGFHPKAVFWKEANGSNYGLIGSSNLSLAAFDKNYEANILVELSDAEFEQARDWISSIGDLSVPISEDWLSSYKEASLNGQRTSGGKGPAHKTAKPLFAIKLPKPQGTQKLLRGRREQLQLHKKRRTKLMTLFRSCADETISPEEFYQTLPDYWSFEAGNRLQGLGWERKGKGADFKRLAKSFVRIVDTPKRMRDDVVAEELDGLAIAKVSVRQALLSEMLCLEFPSEYPLINKPVRNYLKHIKFRGPPSSSEGGKYVDLAVRLRLSLLQNPSHPAKNLAELDAIIWKRYGGNK